MLRVPIALQTAFGSPYHSRENGSHRKSDVIKILRDFEKPIRLAKSGFFQNSAHNENNSPIKKFDEHAGLGSPSARAYLLCAFASSSNARYQNRG
jgi:hypothetical protein